MLPAPGAIFSAICIPVVICTRQGTLLHHEQEFFRGRPGPGRGALQAGLRDRAWAAVCSPKAAEGRECTGDACTCRHLRAPAGRSWRGSRCWQLPGGACGCTAAGLTAFPFRCCPAEAQRRPTRFVRIARQSDSPQAGRTPTLNLPPAQDDTIDHHNGAIKCGPVCTCKHKKERLRVLALRHTQPRHIGKILSPPPAIGQTHLC